MSGGKKRSLTEDTPPLVVTVDPEMAARRAAAARAYALSSTSGEDAHHHRASKRIKAPLTMNKPIMTPPTQTHALPLRPTKPKATPPPASSTAARRRISSTPPKRDFTKQITAPSSSTRKMPPPPRPSLVSTMKPTLLPTAALGEDVETSEAMPSIMSSLQSDEIEDEHADDDDDEEEEDSEYAKFMRSILHGSDDLMSLISIKSLPKATEYDDDDEDEASYQLQSEDDDDDDEDDDDGMSLSLSSAQGPSTTLPQQNQEQLSPKQQARQSLGDHLDLLVGTSSRDMFLDDELNALLEEDMEAAFTTLLGGTPSPDAVAAVTQEALPNKMAEASMKDKMTTMTATDGGSNMAMAASEGGAERTMPPSPRSSSATTATTTNVVTPEQVAQLESLLSHHYQLLVQQSILAVRAASYSKAERTGASSGSSISNTAEDATTGIGGKQGKAARGKSLKHQSNHHSSSTAVNDFYCGETADDLAEILDGAVGMLQDLDQNRKDAIRNSIQLEAGTMKRRSLLPSLAAAAAATTPMIKTTDPEDGRARRLTRSAFTKTLNEPRDAISTAFEIKGISRLFETFATIDNSVRNKNAKEVNILDQPDHGEACEMVFRQAGANYDERFIPGKRDISEHLSYPEEVLGQPVKKPLSRDDQIVLRKNRNQFSAAEDNLILRGVNLYGEKEWLHISDRFLPDRSVTIIAQRYSRLCLLIYKAAGIEIDEEGNLAPPPKHPDGVENFDEVAISKLNPCGPPARFNVHRWSLEEDITLLKAVPLMGHMWAEVSTRLIAHRERGHLRKRYQVLERRVKGTVKKEKKKVTDVGSGEVKCKSGYATKKKDSTTKKKASSNSKKMPGSGSVTNPPKLEIPQAQSGESLELGGASQESSKSYMSNPSSMRLNPQSPSSTHPYPPVTSSSMNVSHGGLSSCESTPTSNGRRRKWRTGKIYPQGRGRDNEGGVSDLLCGEKFDHGGALHVSGNGEQKPLAPLPNDIELSNQFDSTRMGFERILNESNGWSQMSRMKKLIGLENDHGSSIVRRDAIARDDNDAMRVVVQPLPSLAMEPATCSGLSLLNTSQDAGTNGFNLVMPESSRTSKTGGIMASVMERAKQNSAARNQSSAGEANTIVYPGSPPRHVESMASRLNAPHSARSTSMAHVDSETGNAIGSIMFPGVSMDGFEFSSFTISDRSRQAFEGVPGSPTKLHPGSRTPLAPATPIRIQGIMSPPVTPARTTPSRLNNNTTPLRLSNFNNYASSPATPRNNFNGPSTLMDDDLGAIAALNNMSNHSITLGQKEVSQKPSASGPSTSLFAKVVGGIRDKETKRKG